MQRTRFPYRTKQLRLVYINSLSLPYITSLRAKSANTWACHVTVNFISTKPTNFRDFPFSVTIFTDDPEIETLRLTKHRQNNIQFCFVGLVLWIRRRNETIVKLNVQPLTGWLKGIKAGALRVPYVLTSPTYTYSVLATKLFVASY